MSSMLSAICLVVVSLSLCDSSLADQVSIRSSIYSTGGLGKAPTQHYLSEPALKPPRLNLIVPKLRSSMEESGLSNATVNDKTSLRRSLRKMKRPWSLSAIANFSKKMTSAALSSKPDQDLYTFVGYRGKDAEPPAAMILDEHGGLIWSGKPASVLNVDKHVWKGKDVISLYTGTEEHPGYGRGQWQIYNQSYDLVKTIEAQNTTANSTDPHDFQITHNDTAIIEFWQRTFPVDLTSVGGPVQGWVWDCVVQEIDIETNQILFQWSALENVKLNESYYGIAHDNSGMSENNPFDYTHLNSVHKDDEGNFLIGMRGTSSVYYVDGQTGKTLWKLGGKESDFELGPRAHFYWQHTARLATPASKSSFRISLFDNSANQYNQTQPYSRGLILEIDSSTRRASVVGQYFASFYGVTASEGSIQILDNGNVFVGWGSKPFWSEYLANGTVIQNAQFGALESSIHSYRAFKYAWKGFPRTLPSLAVVVSKPSAQLDKYVGTTGGSRLGYVSWNGATEVKSWMLIGGRAKENVKHVIRKARKTGFETEIYLGSFRNYTSEAGASLKKKKKKKKKAKLGYLYLAVAALDDKNQCLAVSEIYDVQNGRSSGIPGICPPAYGSLFIWKHPSVSSNLLVIMGLVALVLITCMRSHLIRRFCKVLVVSLGKTRSHQHYLPVTDTYTGQSSAVCNPDLIASQPVSSSY